MKKSIQFRHISYSEALEQHCDEQIEWLSKHSFEPDNISVYMSIEGHEPKVEIAVKCLHVSYFAEAMTSSFPTAIDQAFQKIGKQLARKKDMVKKHKWKSKVLDSRPAFQSNPGNKTYKKAA